MFGKQLHDATEPAVLLFVPKQLPHILSVAGCEVKHRLKQRNMKDRRVRKQSLRR
jgi:hypothetical protein